MKKLFWPGPVCGCKFFITINNIFSWSNDNHALYPCWQTCMLGKNSLPVAKIKRRAMQNANEPLNTWMLTGPDRPHIIPFLLKGLNANPEHLEISRTWLSRFFHSFWKQPPFQNSSFKAMAFFDRLLWTFRS